jgi:hypothetical protein
MTYSTVTVDHEVPTVTVPCETGRHGRCSGKLFSLLAAVGAACECSCHAQPGRAA